MSNTIITKKELTIPTGVVLEVADILLEKDIINDIIGTDEENDALIIEVQYEKDEREIIHEIEDLISDYEAESEEEEEETESE